MPSRRPRLAKLTRPRLHNAVARERLFKLLDDNSEHGLIWLEGPPGAGKTTLVASWLEARDRTGIWYQADQGDSDLATFFYYLGQAALSLTRRGKRPLPLLTPEYLHDIDGFSRRFFRELFSRLPDGSVLAFDNYQDVLAEAQFHTAVLAAMGELPLRIALLIISRAAPPPLYTRLVAHQRIGVLGWEDLRLSRHECQAIAARKVSIDAQTLEALYLTTGGWAAGFALALEQFKQGGSYTRAEQATQEAIFSYFATQILDRVPQDMKRFLMVSALLPQMSIPVCEALTADKSAADRLDDMYRRHLFTDRRPGTLFTYSYHALFRNFLLECAKRDLCDELPELWVRAARLLEEAGESGSSVRLYCEAQQWGEAQRLIVQEAPKLLAQGRWQTFDEWTGWLPEAQRTRSAWLVYWTGMAHLAMEPSVARARLEQAYSMFTAVNDRMGSLLAASAVAQGMYLEAAEFKELEKWLPALEELLGQQNTFPSPAAKLQAYSGMLIAIIFGRPGHRLARQCSSKILELMSEPIDANQRITAAAAMMLYTLYTGEIRLGRQLEALVQPILAAPELTALNAAFWYCWLGYLSVVDHTLERGNVAFGHAEAIAEREGFPYVLTSAYSGRSSLLRVGDGVDHWLKLAEPSMDSARPYDVAHFLGNSLYRAADRGNWALAAELGERTMSYLQHTGTLYQRLIWEVPTSWALAELGRIEEARQHLAVSDAVLDKTGAYCYKALVTLAHANISRIDHHEEEYVQSLRRGFQDAAQDFAMSRYAFWVPTAGAPRLCADALEHGIETQFVRQSIREYPLPPPSDAPEVWPWPIRVYTLGRFEIILNDAPVAFSHKQPRKPLALLKAIIALGETDVPLQKLIDALWPAEEGDAAEHALEVALLRLRKILVVHDAIRIEDRSLSLNRERVWTDVHALDALTANISSSNDEEQVSRYAQRIFALYKGGFLAADMDAPWAVSRRERTRTRFVQLVSMMGALREAQQDCDEALRWYHRGLEVDDLAESFHQGVMRCYLALGKRAEGLSAFRRMRQALSVTLGIVPSPASEALYRALQSN